MINRYKKYVGEIIYLTGEYKHKIPYLVAMFLILSLLDLAGIGLILPYISLISSPELFFNNAFVSKFVLQNGLDPLDVDTLIVIIGLVLLLLFILKTYFSIYLNKEILKFCYYRGAQLRSLLMYRYQSLPYNQFVKGNSSDYIYKIQSLTMSYSKGTLQSFLRLMSESIVSIAIVVMLMFTDIEVLMILLTILITSYLLYNYFFRIKIGIMGKLANKYNTSIIKFVTEGIEGLKEIRILGKQKFFYDRVKNVSEKYADVSIKNHVIQTIPRYGIELILISFVITIVMIEIVNDRNVNNILPILSMFGIAAIRLTPSINQIIASLNQMIHGRNGLELLYNDVKKFTTDVEICSDNSSSNTVYQSNDFVKLELKNISYRYEGSTKDAINNVSLNIFKGECIGIMGSSGAGKSTLVDIMLGLLTPSLGGEVLFNGQPLKKELLNFQSIVAYLPQETFIMDDTLVNNIAVGEDFEGRNNANLDLAVHKANISEMVEMMPLGLETRVGEKGVLLSGGQRQRVSLARSFYYDREFLIFDESTSALDEKTGLEIMNEIKCLKGLKTILVISHQQRILDGCDYIYDLDKGTKIKG